MTYYCNQCAEKLEDGDTVVRDHQGAYYHYDCWKDGGCEPPDLKAYDYQEEHDPEYWRKRLKRSNQLFEDSINYLKGMKSMPNPSTADPVNHPPHYTSHPSGIECIQVTEHMGFCLGNAIKYCWRADLKHDAIEDMKKAIWYIEREIQKRGKA